jgi:hypothetical protein
MIYKHYTEQKDHFIASCKQIFLLCLDYLWIDGLFWVYIGWCDCYILLRNIFVIYDHGYVLFGVITIKSFPHSWLITGFVIRVTRRVPLAEQEQLNLPDHPHSPRCLARFILIIFPPCLVFFSSLHILSSFLFWLIYRVSFFNCNFFNS